MLIAGGDSGGVLETVLGGLPQATFAHSTASSEIYSAIADTFSVVGPLGTSRELTAPAVVLPNNKVLIVGGSHCYATAINDTEPIAASPTGATEVGNTVTITTSVTQSFGPGGTVVISGVGVVGYNGTFTIATIVSSTQFTYTDPTPGLAASGGGTATDNPGSAACGTTGTSGFECDALDTAELYTPTSSSAGTFTVAGFGGGGTGHMSTQRSGATATLISGSGSPLDGKVLIMGGSMGSGFLPAITLPVGCGPPGQVAQNTAEIYDPVADTFTPTTSVPGCAIGTGPPTCTTMLPGTCPVNATVPIAASPTGATESGNTVTVTTTVAHGFAAGDTVIVSSVGGTNTGAYNGNFVIASVPTSTTFTYTDASTGLAGSGGGAATSQTGQQVCGLADSAAVLLNDGTVLVAGGDYRMFLGQSSQQSFIFSPSTATWAATANLNVPRELPGQVKLPSGDVLLTGGLNSAAAACVWTGTPPGSTPVAFTTNSSAEVYDPVAKTWTPTSGSMSVPRIASIELFTSGTDSGMVIAAGGIDSETTNGAGTNTFPTCEPGKNIAQASESATDLFDETTGKFTPTGALKQDRFFYASAILNAGTHAGDLAVFGGACGTMPPTPLSFVIGTADAGNNCDNGSGTAATDYYEFFNPSSGTWTVGTGTTPTTPAAGPASALLP